jgi:exopolysaccharide biosynthesis polyprenyl glycosylphosphotransferase
MTPLSTLTATALSSRDIPRVVVRPRSRPIKCERMITIVDTSIMAAVLIGVLVLTNLDTMPDGIQSFLALRITVKNVVLLTILVSTWPLIFRLFGLYDEDQLPTWLHETTRAAAACSIGSWLALLFAFTSVSERFQVQQVIAFWIAAVAGMVILRGLRRLIAQRQATPRRVIIVGTGPRGIAASERLRAAGHTAYEIVGFVETADWSSGDHLATRTLGTLDDLENILMRQAIDEVFVALPVKSRYPDILQAIQVCERTGIPAKYQADIFHTALARPEYDEAQGTPTVTLHVAPNDSRLLLKRAIDLAGGALALIAFAPVMIGIAIAIKMTSRGPVFFAQDRYGLNKRLFRMYKFRTMVVGADRLQAELEDRNEMDGPVFKIRHDPRVTRLGRFLRRTSLDELPQLLHVVTGDMSLVGPRPLPVRDVARFVQASDMRRFSVRPGLTCLWQISGRSNLAFEEWIRLDLVYIDAWSLSLDVEILVRTIPAVLRGVGAT